ncbi:MAG TPA: hypothetical protein V6C85_25895 [Allocoleopsis sp.]
MTNINLATRSRRLLLKDFCTDVIVRQLKDVLGENAIGYYTLI